MLIVTRGGGRRGGEKEETGFDLYDSEEDKRRRRASRNPSCPSVQTAAFLAPAHFPPLPPPPDTLKYGDNAPILATGALGPSTVTNPPPLPPIPMHPCGTRDVSYRGLRSYCQTHSCSHPTVVNGNKPAWVTAEKTHRYRPLTVTVCLCAFTCPGGADMG